MRTRDLKFLLLGCLAVPVITIAQNDQGFIGGNSSGESIQEFHENTIDAAANPATDFSNNLTELQIESLVLIRVMRTLEGDVQPLSSEIQGIFNPDEIEIIKADLNDALSFSARTIASSRVVMCDAWNNSKDSRADAFEFALSEYRKEDLRIQPLVDERFQNVLINFNRAFGTEKMNVLYIVLEPDRSRYATASVANFDDLILFGENGVNRMESLCN